MMAMAFAAPAWADDIQLWATAVAQGPIGGGDHAPIAVFELQQRAGDDLSRPTVSLVRAGLGTRISPDVVIFAGYHFQRNTPGDRAAVNEHRMWQQVGFLIYNDGQHLTVTARLRLEERIVEGAHDLGWRGRAQLRLQVPLAGRGSAGALLWTEALLPLNDTDWGQRRRIHQYRWFLGAFVPLGRRFNVEAGYMTRLDRIAGGPRISHVANVTVSYRLGD